MNRLVNIINGLGYEELKSIERDLSEGNIERLIKDKLLQFEKGEKICPVCYRHIEDNEENFTLLFGPKGFQKKATFCGIDCLEFFISKVKDIRGHE